MGKRGIVGNGVINSMEQFVKIYDGKYEVSSDGYIVSNVGTRKRLVGKVGDNGYNMVVLTVNGKKLYPMVHRLVAKAFIPNPKNLREVNHIDGNKLNNAASNLEWVTTRENQIHARDMGLETKCKINMEIANMIRADVGTQRELSKKYGLTQTEIGLIRQNKRWAV